MSRLMTCLQLQLEKRRAQGNYRELRCSSAQIDFASNDYLGFLHDGLLDNAMKEEEPEARRWGSGGSRLLTGHSAYCESLENEIASFHREEAGLIFNSGYVAALGLLSAVVRREDTIIYDTHVHASWHDAMKLTRARVLPLRHLDLSHLEYRLKQACGNVFVCVESVYSCSGMLSPLCNVHQLCQRAGAHLIVDEAHATGWLGKQGEGAVQLNGLQGKIFARVHTFSKALGAQGAIVLGSSLLRDYLINFARSFIYTTALPPCSLAAIRCAYNMLDKIADKRERLQRVIQYFRSKLGAMPLRFENSVSPIQCLYIPGNEGVKGVAEKLQKTGFDVRPLLSPTVKRGQECLRICLHAFNTEGEVDTLLAAL